MNIPLPLRRSATVVASTALGAALGYGLLRVAGEAIARHLPRTVKPTGPDDGGFGG